MDEEQVILGIVIIVLSLGMTIFAITKKPFSNIVDYIIAFFGVLLVILATTQLVPCPTKEGYSNNSNIERILGLLANQNTKITASSSSNETLSLFARNLTVYYSAFSTNSFPNSSRRWYNIAPFFTSPQSTCPDVTMEDTNMFFLEVPSFSKDNGFSLGNNKILGPKSYEMGFSANDSFTMFFTLRFNEFPVTEKSKEIFRFFANTRTNNGISMFFDSVSSVVNEMANVSLMFSFGEETWSTSLETINMAYIYFFVIQKNGHTISVNVYPNIGDLSSSSSFVTNIFNVKLDLNTDVLLSNKEMVINGNQTLQANIFNFGIFNRAVMEHTISDLYTNIQKEIQKGNELLQDMNSTIAELQNQIQQSKQCPYDVNTCASCPGITDWTNMSSVILGATPECLNAINTFCNKNPTNSLCSCWNPQNLLSKTDQCKNYVGIFSGNSCATNDNLSSDQLSVIQQKYNLCSCAETKKAPQAVPTVVVPAPKLVDNIYNYNATDVDLYNSLNISSMVASKNNTTRNPNPNDNTNVSTSLWKR